MLPKLVGLPLPSAWAQDRANSIGHNNLRGITAMFPKFRFAIRSGIASTTVGLVIFGASLAVAEPVDTGNLQEVVVTARKRSENLQDVPTAVTAVNPQTAEAQQFENIVDLSASVPNLIVYPQTTNTTSGAVYIRGLGQDDSTPVQESQVAVYIDDVYMPRSQGTLIDLGDFERIEVLRGPQGTLYGRNSDGGAIKYVTVKPSLTDTNGWAEVIGGSFERTDVRAAYSTPLIENMLGVKIDVVSRDRNGYVSQVNTGDDFQRIDRQTGRVAFRFVPSSDITWDLAVDGSHDHSGLQAPVPIAPVPGGTLEGGYGPVYGSFYVTGADAPDHNDTSIWGVANTVAWDNPIGTLKSVTSYRRIEQSFNAPLSGLPAPNGQVLNRNFEDRDFTQEFQLTSRGDSALTYVGGLFFLSEEFHNKDIFFILDDYFQTTYSYAAYGELTYKLTQALNVTGGLRYTEDQKKLSGNYIGLSGPFSVNDFDLTYTNFSPKGSIDYHLSGQNLLYASITDGYQAGGYQGFPQALTDVTVQTVKPAKVTAYEIGSKNDFWDRRATVNLALFYSLLHDKQVSAFNPATLGYVSGSVNETIKGAELEFAVRLTEELKLTGFGSWLHAEVTQSAYPADPLVPPIGSLAAFTPQYMGKIGLEWDRPLSGRGGHLFGAMHFQEVGKIYYDIFNTPSAASKAHGLLDARFGYRTADGRFEVALGGENLTNVQWFNNASTNGTMWPQPPRTWSLGVKFRM